MGLICRERKDRLCRRTTGQQIRKIRSIARFPVLLVHHGLLSAPAESGLNAAVGAFMLLLYGVGSGRFFVPPDANAPASP